MKKKKVLKVLGLNYKKIDACVGFYFPNGCMLYCFIHRHEQMEAIESQEHEGSNYKDPYGEVMKKPEHNGRVRLFGKGVTMTDLKKRGKNSSYIFPQEFLQSMQSQVVGQLLDANPQLKQLLEANPEVKIMLPDMTGSNGRSPASESNGHSSIGAHSDNRLVHVELNDGMEEENRIQPTV